MLLQRVVLQNLRLALQRGLREFDLKRAGQAIRIKTSTCLDTSLLASLWGLEVASGGDCGDVSVTEKAETLQEAKRKMKDSYCELELPFLADKCLLEDYSAFYGGIRLGKLLEDLDILAACIAYSHCGNGGMQRDLAIVTASVDKIDLLMPTLAVGNYKCSGHVTFVGTSSMEVSIVVVNESVSADSAVAIARFTMVARNAQGKAAKVAPLVLETADENLLFETGKLNKDRKMAEKSPEFAKEFAPSMNENELLHQLFNGKESAQAAHAEPVKGIEETKVCSTKLCHLQERNIHNFIFGGFLMKEAYDLAYVAACKFLFFSKDDKKTTLETVSLDEISFKVPIPIGTILEFCSKVVYSQECEFCVHTTAKACCPWKREEILTNEFIFTFRSNQPVPKVMPNNYSDALLFLQQRRKREHSQEC